MAIAINWGSTNLRAYLINDAGALHDTLELPRGIIGLSRSDMVGTVASIAARWPHARRIIASGMIGSNVGWVEATYRPCPVALDQGSADMTRTIIGEIAVDIVPGLTCTGPHGMPDVMRGEEVEIGGALRLAGPDVSRRFVCLPGTHTKWAQVVDGSIVDFFTSMSGEIFDRLTHSGLLASITDGKSDATAAFDEGVDKSMTSGLSLGTLLFSARSMVVRGALKISDSGSYLRGVLIGSELRDAFLLYPAMRDAPLLLTGADGPCALYAHALRRAGVETRTITGRNAVLAGYATLIRSEVHD